jgi:hypothetical protein
MRAARSLASAAARCGPAARAPYVAGSCGEPESLAVFPGLIPVRLMS